MLFLVEEWESREQFERNLDSAKLNTIVAAIELSSEAPVVHVDSVERRKRGHVGTSSNRLWDRPLTCSLKPTRNSFAER